MIRRPAPVVVMAILVICLSGGVLLTAGAVLYIYRVEIFNALENFYYWHIVPVWG